MPPSTVLNLTYRLPICFFSPPTVDIKVHRKRLPIKINSHLILCFSPHYQYVSPPVAAVSQAICVSKSLSSISSKIASEI